MTVKRMQNAYYVVRDMGAAAAFYRDALGLKVKFQDGARWAQFDVNGVNFSLSSPEEAPMDASGGVVVFEVDDAEATATRIVAGGGEVLGRRDMGDHGKTLTFRDPAGNIVQLFQRKAG